MKLLALIDERDRRYTELRAADQKAIDAALAAQERAVAAALAAAKEAVNKAEDASNKRFDGVNEFRATLSDQAAHLMPRAECELRLKALEDIRQQRAGMSQGWAFICGAFGIGGVLYGTLHR